MLIAIFLCGLVLPVLDHFFQLDHGPPLVEKRTPAPLPSLPRDWAALRAFPSAFEHYWNDGFGFRRMLVRAYARTLVALRTSPLPDRVVVGSGDWLFYTAEGSLDEYRGERPFSESEMVRWQYLLEARRDWLNDRGIPYIFFIAPNKETIYPEHMPRGIQRGAVHRLDQLLEFLAAHSDFEIIDPRGSLLSAKQRHDMYRKTDTHWNARGALLVEESIAERLARIFPSVRSIAPEALTAATGIASGDLVGMIGLGGLLSESWETITLTRPRAHAVGTPTNISSWTEVDDPSLPRGVFFHDSFGAVQSPYLAEHFSHLRHAWIREMEPAIVEAEHVQVVVHEMTERFLWAPVPNDSMLLADNSHVRASFDASSIVLFRLSGGAGAITPETDLSIDSSSDGTMTLEAKGTRSSAKFPIADASAGTMSVVRVQIESPAEGHLEIWYQTRSEHEYDQRRSAWWPLHPGSNVAWFVLPDPELAGRLRLDLSTPGTYRLTGLEVRAVSCRGDMRKTLTP